VSARNVDRRSTQALALRLWRHAEVVLIDVVAQKRPSTAKRAVDPQENKQRACYQGGPEAERHLGQPAIEQRPLGNLSGALARCEAGFQRGRDTFSSVSATASASATLGRDSFVSGHCSPACTPALPSGRSMTPSAA
jgi:hypothetical protein